MEPYNSQILICCVLFTTSAIFIQTGSATDISKRSETLNSTIQQILGSNDKLSEVGSYGDKIYFSEPFDDCSFELAENVCKLAGLELVMLNSPQELEYLGSQLKEDVYWLNGQDKNEYYWTQNGGDVNFSIDKFIPPCLTMINGQLGGFPCDATVMGCPWINVNPLCQLIVTEGRDTF